MKKGSKFLALPEKQENKAHFDIDDSRDNKLGCEMNRKRLQIGYQRK